MCRHDELCVSTGSDLVVRSGGRLPWALRAAQRDAACRVLGRGRRTSTRSPGAAAEGVRGTGGAGSFGGVFTGVSKLTAAFHSQENSTPNCPYHMNIILNFSISKVFLELQSKGKKSNTERNHVNPCKTRAVLQGFRRSFPGTEGLGRSLEWPQLTLKWTPEGFRKILEHI